MRYRRFYQTGGTYFFTVVTDKRQKILTDETVRSALRQATIYIRFGVFLKMMPLIRNVGGKLNGTANI